MPGLAFVLDEEPNVSEPVYRQLDGSLLSADISGFTRLTEALAERGREGAEIITRVVNACFHDLIGAAENFGGDVIKFGGDAILVFFSGDAHERRALAAGREMQIALRRNTQARNHQLKMTVGMCDGPFEAMVIGTDQRDLLICGPNVTATLRYEAAAEKGEVVAGQSLVERARSTSSTRSEGFVVHDETLALKPVGLPNDLTDESAGAFIAASLRSYYGDYADQGAQHRQAAIGFCVIGGVDEYIESAGGAETTAQLSRLLDAIVDGIAPFGVTVLHSDLGEGAVKLLLGAGVPSSAGDHADAIVHAALAIRSIENPFDIRQGINVGTVFAGFLGASHRRTFTVMGDVVNTAARMSGQAGPGEIVAVDDVLQRARGAVTADALPPLTVKGKNEPVIAHRVTAVGPPETQAAADHVTLTGRDDELSAIQQALAAGDSLSIVGPAGSGKTRLGEEARPDEGVLVAAGDRYAAATPYGAFAAALRTLFDIGPSLGAKQAGELLASALGRIAPQIAGQASLIAPAFAADLEESDEVAAIAPEFRRDALHRAVTDLLARLEPDVRAILVDDVQWLDDASRDLVEHLEQASTANGWVVVRSGRDGAAEESDETDLEPNQGDPAEADAGQDDSEPSSGRVNIVLGALDASAIEQIIVEACPRRLRRRELDDLVARAGGNPLFAIELANTAAEAGASLPGSIEELLIARIDRLPAPQRSAVRLAAVFGARFEAAHYREVAEASGFDLELDLEWITEMFVIEDGVAQFRQLLYRDAAYASLPFGRRKLLHGVVGDYLEANTDDVDAISMLLSQHFALAGDRRRCWKYSNQAAERAQRQHSPADAEVLYRRALDNVPRGIGNDERAVALCGLAEALLSTGSLSEAHELFGKARRSATETAEKQRLLGRQGVCRERQGRYSDALRVFSRMINADDVVPAAEAVAYNGRASVLYHLGRAAEALDNCRQALSIASSAGLWQEQTQALKLMHITAEATGDDAFGDYATQALAIARREVDLSAEAEILSNIGVSEQYAGRLEEAADAYRESLEIKQKVGDRAGAAMIRMNLSEVELDREVTDGIDELLLDCLAEFDDAGFTIGSTYTRGLLGRHALLTGRAEEAADFLTDAAAAFGELGADGYVADMELMLIEASINLQRFDEAASTLARNRERLARGDVFDNPDAAAARLDALEERLAEATT